MNDKLHVELLFESGLLDGAFSAYLKLKERDFRTGADRSTVHNDTLVEYLLLRASQELKMMDADKSAGDNELPLWIQLAVASVAKGLCKSQLVL